jgi:hypothetical protein
MEYTYEIPITVLHISDEHEDLLQTKRSIVDFVVTHLPNTPWRDFFPDEVEDCRIEPRKDRLLVHMFTSSGVYSQAESDRALRWLDDWMRYGYFEGGLTIPGRYNGYPYDEIVVTTWYSELPITAKSKAVEIEPRPGI